MRRLLLPAAWLMLAAGCGSPTAGTGGPAPTLVVTLDGKPLGGVQVQLATADGKGVASGTTDAAGAVTLRAGDGTPPPAGSYKVVLADAGDEEQNPMEPPKRSASNRVPAGHGRAATTKVAVTLDGTAGPFPVDVKSK